MASNVKSTPFLLGICVLYHAIWLDGRTNAKKLGKDISSHISCGGTYDSAPGHIDHPVTSGSYYNSDEICTWTISSSIPLAFYFSEFNLEEVYDHVSIRDGGTIGSPLIQELSGKSLHSNFTTAGDTHIQFESDSSVVGTGFVLQWRYYSAEDQCKEKKGVCVQTGDKCEGTFEMIKNSCDDRCVCCILDEPNQECIGGVIIANQCLKFSTEQFSWEDAKERCLSQNARLATLNDPEAFQDYARTNYGGNKFWVGGEDFTNEGQFVWSNGQALGNQFPWPSTQPDNGDNNEDCLMWGFEGSFNDDPCHAPHGFVCEH